MTAREEIELLKETAKLRAEISNSLEGYIEGLKRAKAVDQEIIKLRNIENDVLAKKNAALKLGTAAGIAEAAKQQRILGILINETDVLEKQNNILKDNLKTVNKTNLLMEKGAASMVKAVANLPNLIESGYGKIKSLGLFDMDKAIKKSALSMGLMTNEANSFRNDIGKASEYTLDMGVGIEELAKYQSDYSEALGRTVMLNKEGLKAMADMAAATALGAEGAVALAADFEQVGLSAERTRDFVEQTMNDSHKMGLNSSKVIKNIQQNFKLLNKYNFKGGIKGLAAMAVSSTKLGVDMNSITGMADKLFDIEPAVEMSAQLQVMGGEWAKMSDPFHMMNEARTTMSALNEEVYNAAASAFHFNSATDEFESSAMEMQKLRKVSEITGIALEELAKGGRKAAEFTKIKGQISFKADKDTKEFLVNTAKFDKGRAYIEMDIDGKKTKRFLNELDGNNLKQLEIEVKKKKTLEEYAKSSRTFDDALMNVINQLKAKLLPFVEVLDKELIPKLDVWIKSLKDGKWLEKIENFAKYIGGVVSDIAGFVMDNPIWTTALIGLAKGLSFLAQKANWLMNGLALAEGFNIGTGFSSLGKSLAGPLGMLGKSVNVLAVGIAGWAAGKWLGGKVSELRGKKSTEEGDTASMWTAGSAALAGAAIGSVFGGVGAIPGYLIGAGIGALVGGFGGKVVGDAYNQPSHDGVIPAGYQPKQFDKGTAILKNGTINPINNKDDLLTMKPDGPVAKKLGTADNSPNVVKHEFNELRINGELKVTTPGNTSASVDLLRSPEFIRSITHMIQVEMQRGKNQVQKA